ncbi:hypothetical protein OEA41_010322 [Lepraria neglecta]|uniref:Rhodopsin domain-containing protein n=1 Tax=Lepraria neglecta TaxID=209136 RepID=A0AAD9YXK8_9LECA|nr:hypothetical protein OEA41_010322 [Lepraria neglecta]
MATVPTAAELQDQRDHINETLVPSLVASNTVCLILAYIAVALRFLCRRMTRVKYEYDDWFIVAGLTLLAVEVIYQAATFSIKASILYLYHRVFFVSHRFTKLLWAVVIFILIYSGVQGMGALIQCVPISANWDPTIKRHCLPIGAPVTIFAVCNVLTDFVILILPMPLLWGLQQPLERKIKIMGIFMLGGFVCFASIYRAVVIHNLTPIDPSYTDIQSQVWTAIEMGMGVVSVCLPTYRPIFSRMVPKFKNKLSSWNSGLSGRTLQEWGGGPDRIKSGASEIELQRRNSNTTLRLEEPTRPELSHTRMKPSQSSAFAHLGVLGDNMDLEEGRKEEPVPTAEKVGALVRGERWGW